MEKELLKANFKLKSPVNIAEEKKMSFQQEYKKRALSSIGGSMVYMERERLIWEGDL